MDPVGFESLGLPLGIPFLAPHAGLQIEKIGVTTPRELDKELYAKILMEAGHFEVPVRRELLDYEYVRAGHIHIMERTDWANKTREQQRKTVPGGREKDGPRGGWNRQGHAKTYTVPGFPSSLLYIERMAAREKKERGKSLRKLEVFLVSIGHDDNSPLPTKSIIHYRDDDEPTDPEVPFPIVLRALPAQASSSGAGPSGAAWQGVDDVAGTEEPMPAANPRPQPPRKRSRRRCPAHHFHPPTLMCILTARARLT